MTADTVAPADVVRRIIEAFNAQDVEAGLELVHPDIADHAAPPGLAPGRAGWRQKWEGMFGTFTGMHATIEETVVDGDVAASRYRIRGVQTGELAGHPATGRSFEVLAMDMVRVEDGRIIEHWALNDVASMLSQLGLDTGGG